VEELSRDVHTLKHRVEKLEQERLPTRVAQLEAVVPRVEQAVEEINKNMLKGISEIKTELSSQRAVMKGVAVTLSAVVALLGALLTLKELIMP